MDRLKGKTAIISGGATGMGAASARLFAAEGAAVGVIDRNVEAGEALVAELKAKGHKAVFAKANVAAKAEVEAAVAAVNAALGPVNVLFNHAGTIVIKPFLETE
jgi:NAD(P)-dependent dehydrogenase (short-subunit alcohol dehydrogenase family)